jgi:hypothetical protein
LGVICCHGTTFDLGLTRFKQGREWGKSSPTKLRNYNSNEANFLRNLGVQVRHHVLDTGVILEAIA